MHSYAIYVLFSCDLYGVYMALFYICRGPGDVICTCTSSNEAYHAESLAGERGKRGGGGRGRGGGAGGGDADYEAVSTPHNKLPSASHLTQPPTGEYEPVLAV